MTMEEFLERFAEVARGFRWELDSRALRTDGPGRCHCPITAVAAKAGGVPYWMMSVDRAVEIGMRLGLSRDDAYEIMTAADGVAFNVRTNSPVSADVRSRLLAAAGFEGARHG